MKGKEVLKACSFAVIFILLLVAVTYCVRMNGDVKDRFVGFYAEKRDTLDAVIVGSSPVYPAFATPQLYGEQGIAMYPMSSNMQRPVAARYLTEEVLKYQKPALMIYELRMYTAADEELLGNMAHTREVTDNLRYSPNRVRTIMAMVDDSSQYKEYMLDIFKYHSNWKTLVLPSQLRTFTYAWPNPAKGHILYDEVGPAEGDFIQPGDELVPIYEEQEGYLRELMAYLKERDQEALFLIIPHTTGYEDRDAKYRYMAELIEAEGFRFMNLNSIAESEIGIDRDTDYRDYGNHLNAAGAAKLTAWFGAWLKENYEFEDHRGDGRYSSWDRAYEDWKQAYADAESSIAEHVSQQTYYVISEE